MTFKIIASLLVIILVFLLIYSKFYRKKELEIADAERNYFNALKNKEEKSAFEYGLKYFLLKGITEEKAKEAISKDLANA